MTDTCWGTYLAQRLADLANGVGDFTDLKRPTAATVDHARRVAAEHFRPTTPTPSVVPTADGEIDLVWHKNGHDAELTVSETRADLWVRHRASGEEWTGLLPDHARCCLQRLLDALEGGRMTAETNQPHEYCVVHDQPIDWCRTPDRCRETMKGWGLYPDDAGPVAGDQPI